MSRTTLDLDASVLAQLRRRAASEHKSMGQVASEHLAASLAEKTTSRGRAPLSWPRKRMGASRVDLLDKDALWKMLDTSRTGSEAG